MKGQHEKSGKAIGRGELEHQIDSSSLPSPCRTHQLKAQKQQKPRRSQGNRAGAEHPGRSYIGLKDLPKWRAVSYVWTRKPSPVKAAILPHLYTLQPQSNPRKAETDVLIQNADQRKHNA